MRILSILLLLCGGLNLIWARSLPWITSRPEVKDYQSFWWNYDNDYELFALPRNQYSNEGEHGRFKEIFSNDNSNESKETLTPFNDADNYDDEVLTALHNAFEEKQTTSSEEDNHNDKIEPPFNDEDVEDLAALVLGLSVLDDITKFPEQSDGVDDVYDDNDNDMNHVDSNEEELLLAQEFFDIIESILEKSLENELKSSKETDDANQKDNDNESQEGEETDMNKENHLQSKIDEVDNDADRYKDDEISNQKEHDNKSDNDSEENKNGDNDKNNDDDDDDNNSNEILENETGDSGWAFYGIDSDLEQNLNDHKYKVVQTKPHDLKPSTPHHSPETVLSPENLYDGLEEYVEIRQNLETLNHFLLKNEQNLDKDFYAIVSHEFNPDNMKRFEQDIGEVYDSLNRIKRNFDAIQNMQSKIYFQELIKTSIQEALSNEKRIKSSDK